jgi:hypothetical protein
MSREPGKKIRTERFKLKSGKVVELELRLLDDGQFYVQVERTGYRNKKLEDLRAEVKPLLEAINTITWRPVIIVFYNKPGEDGQHWVNSHYVDKTHVTIGFNAGWVSTEPVDGMQYRWQSADPDEKTHELPPLKEDEWKKDYTYPEDMLPFTPDRWRTLLKIQAGLIDIQAKIAELVGDSTGLKLDAMTLPMLLEAAPPAEKARGR